MEQIPLLPSSSVISLSPFIHVLFLKTNSQRMQQLQLTYSVEYVLSKYKIQIAIQKLCELLLPKF